VERFVGMMNRKAKSMGLESTAFKNPSGLPEVGHYTTAEELALIMREALKNETFCRITGEKRYQIGEQTVVNHNKLLSLYSPCIGGKTGYTIEAGRCLVSVAQKNGASLICVTLGRRDDWNIHINAYEKWFSSVKSQTLAEKEGLKIPMVIAGGGSAIATNCDKVLTYSFADQLAVETVVLGENFIYGNKEAGDVVGTVKFFCNEVEVGQSPLVLCQEIQVPIKKELFITRIIRFFRRFFLKND
jgi:D-alanyl-D-alanine carboxypeptidase